MTTPDLIGSERDVLIYYLNKNRNAVVDATEGLTAEQQRTPGVGSGTNLLGMVRHLTAAEDYWFRLFFLGEPGEVEWSMQVGPDADPVAIVADYRAACARSDEIIRACPDLSTLSAPDEDQDDRISLRRVAAHMLEEIARHAGQADILRELIDGRTND
jgi:uncharacterized damage-inducible protein DinB